MSENCWDVVLSFSLCCARVQGLDEPAQHVLGMVTYLQSHMRETEYHKKQRKRSGHCVISAHCTGEWGRRMSVCAVVCQSWHPVAHALEKTDGWRLRRGVGDGVYEVVKEGEQSDGVPDGWRVGGWWMCAHSLRDTSPLQTDCLSTCNGGPAENLFPTSPRLKPPSAHTLTPTIAVSSPLIILVCLLFSGEIFPILLAFRCLSFALFSA